MVWRSLGTIEAIRWMAGRKPHVQHRGSASSRTSICSVLEVEEFAIEKIFQAAGSGDDQPGPAANGAELQPFGETTDDKRRGGELLAAQRVVLIHHLHGQLARGHKHQRCNARSRSVAE